MQTILSVCMVIRQGTLGRDLTVRPIATDGTAMSNFIIVVTVLSYHNIIIIMYKLMQTEYQV